jgi:hypothetical protein
MQLLLLGLTDPVDGAVASADHQFRAGMGLMFVAMVEYRQRGRASLGSGFLRM